MCNTPQDTKDWQRLDQVIQRTGLSTNAFAKQIGLKRSENLYQIKRDKNRISRDLADLIVARYPDISGGWLLTGEGRMLREADRSVPFYSVDLLRLASDPDDVARRNAPADRLRVPGLGTSTFAALAPGDAMAPDIPSGAVVVVRQVDPLDAVLAGEIYVVVTGEYVRMGYIRPDRQVVDGLWLDPPAGSAADPVGLGRERIRRLYLVTGIIVRKVL